MARRGGTTLLVSLIAIAGSMPSQAASGVLDPTFARDGKRIVSFATMASAPGAGIARQRDGKIVVVGTRWDDVENSKRRFAIARLNPRGSLDTSFSGDGKAFVAFTGTDAALAVRIQRDGKIVIVGIADYHHAYQFAIARLNRNGTLDSSFNGDGKRTFAFPYSINSFPSDLRIQPDGKIVVVGSVDRGSLDWALLRLNANGRLDRTFGDGGLIIKDFSSTDLASALVIRSDGKMVVSGLVGNAFAVARFNRHGTLDQTFGYHGLTTTSLGDLLLPGSGAEGLKIQSDGKIVVAGTVDREATHSSDFAILRYTPRGTLDQTFSKNGIAFTNFFDLSESNSTGSWDRAHDVVIQQNGKIVGVGAAGSFFALARYNADGTKDATFGRNGKMMTLFHHRAEAFRAVTQLDGKILVVGRVFAPNRPGSYSSIGIARYFAN